MNLIAAAKRISQLLRDQGIAGLQAKLSDKLRDRRDELDYQKWLKRHALTAADQQEIVDSVAALTNGPLISVILPVYNTDAHLLRRCIDSVRSQIYRKWELCIADDASTLQHIRPMLEHYAAEDDRIKVTFREKNGHISAASNSALESATGEFAALLDHDDELAADALARLAIEINEHPECELIYSDEDLIDTDGNRSRPRFKPDWSPDLFLSLNLLNHLVAFRMSTLKQIGGFREGFEGSQDYDLELRLLEAVRPDTIRHIPQILYHWRSVPGSVALAGSEKPYAHERARVAIREHLERTGRPAEVSGSSYDLHRVVFKLPEVLPRVSLIFDEFRDSAGGTELSHFLDATDYPEVEILQPEWKGLMDSATAKSLNDAAERAAGEILCFASSTFRPLSNEWLTELVRWVHQPEIGAVGPRLLNKKGRVLNGGFILGVRNAVAFAHSGFGREALGNMFRNRFPGNFSAVSACFMVIRRSVFEQLRGFDDKEFPEHFFDVDLCLRLTKMEKRIVVNPFAELIQCDSHIPRILLEEGSNDELVRLKERWPDELRSDPFYNRNLSSVKGDFSIDL
jgi:glycosyltransferase involved in cell wall biosynthesis